MVWNLTSRRDWQPVFATLLIVAVAAVVRIELLQCLGLRHRFLTFYPAVVMAALYGGLYCGVLASALSALLADYFLMEPLGELSVHDGLNLVIFVIEGLVVSCITEGMRRAQASAKEADAYARIAEERRHTAELLRESEERLRLALEGGQMGLWEWDLATDTAVWNDKEYELMGLPQGDGRVDSEEFYRAVHPDDIAEMHLSLAEALRGDQFSHEFRIVRPDGEVRWLVGRGRLCRNAAGEPSRMIGVNYDITSKKSAEEELLRSEAKARARADELDLLVDTVPAITFIAHDPECRHISCSQRTRHLLRVPEGTNVSKSAPEGERPLTFRAMKDGAELTTEQLPVQMAARGCEVRDFELTLLFDDGTSRDIVGDAVPLHDESGRVRGAVGAFLDITERKKYEKELQSARDELEKRVEERTAELRSAFEALKREADKRLQTVEALRERDQMLIQQGRLAAMGEMLSNIAHQWRQPLNSLGLLIQELPLMYKVGGFDQNYLNARVEKGWEIICHMSQTIDDFRNFFRPNREKVWFKAEEVVAKTVSLVEGCFRNLQIEVEVDVAGDPEIFGYPNECSQVFLNIFSNSKDAFLERNVPKPRKVTVRIFKEKDKAVITIADNAGGIPEAVIGKIFDPYFTTKGPETGTGLGLFMSKSIIEKNMSGRLDVRNIDGGAEFRIQA